MYVMVMYDFVLDRAYSIGSQIRLQPDHSLFEEFEESQGGFYTCQASKYSRKPSS